MVVEKEENQFLCGLSLLNSSGKITHICALICDIFIWKSVSFIAIFSLIGGLQFSIRDIFGINRHDYSITMKHTDDIFSTKGLFTPLNPDLIPSISQPYSVKHIVWASL